VGNNRLHRACVLFELKAQHHVIGVAHDVDFTPCVPLSPLLDPQIEHVMQVDIRHQGADPTPLRRSFLHPAQLAFFHDARVQPLHQQPHHASVRDLVLEELLVGDHDEARGNDEAQRSARSAGGGDEVNGRQHALGDQRGARAAVTR
jgi:hypothetical protein